MQPPRGTQDYLPEEMIKRQYVLDNVRRIFEQCGFDPLETPAFEEWKLLSSKGGEDVKNEIYYFKDKSNRELGLRFDLTVPLARIIASDPSIPKPFRRYCIGRVWRYDRPGAGRRREFWQADIDIAGSDQAEADAEVLNCIVLCLTKLGVNDIIIRANDRQAVESYLLGLKIDKEKLPDVFRAIDKLEKIGEAEVKKILEQTKLTKTSIEGIFSMFSSGIKSEYLDKVLEACKDYKISEYIKKDPSLVRGLDYYTGPVFEIVTKDAEWSIAGGGRYDKMISAFSGKDVACVGMSLGIERIIELMNRRKLFKNLKTKTQVYIASVGNVRKQMFRIAGQLREDGINTEINVTDRGLSSQLKYCSSKLIPWMLIIGERDMEKKQVTLRNLISGTEETISLEKVAEVLKNKLCNNIGKRIIQRDVIHHPKK
ncbi:MAG: histidine--tRNA ligase [Candidatus Aenigmarchaeota archaeon]|nr:histidine--tRNA ligase [Candidatus Aenigmarchaeota archaeon]